MSLLNLSKSGASKVKKTLPPCVKCGHVHPPGDCPATPKGMLSTNPSLERYRRATVKQVVTFFDGEDFTKFVKRLQKIMQETGSKNHTEVFVAVVDFWEQHHPATGK